MRSEAVHVWQRELSGRESRGPQMSFCAKGKHRLVCLDGRAYKATVAVVVYVAEPVGQGICGANVSVYQSACQKYKAFSVRVPKSLAVALRFPSATNDYFSLLRVLSVVRLFSLNCSVHKMQTKQTKLIISSTR